MIQSQFVIEWKVFAVPMRMEQLFLFEILSICQSVKKHRGRLGSTAVSMELNVTKLSQKN